jgi:hypothetical protein
MRLARNGDVEGFSAYVRSDVFLAAFNGLKPGRRQSDPLPRESLRPCASLRRAIPSQPGPLDAKRSQKHHASARRVPPRGARAWCPGRIDGAAGVVE